MGVARFGTNREREIMHCPCCCKAGGAGAGVIPLIIGIALAVHFANTIIEAIRIIAITLLVGEAIVAVILITGLVLYFQANRPVTSKPAPYRAEVIEREPVHVITSAPARPLPAPARVERIGIEPPRVSLNGAPCEPVGARRARPRRKGAGAGPGR
jgi:hypothetical protein